MKRSVLVWGGVVAVGVAWMMLAKQPPVAVEVMTVGTGKVEHIVANTRAGTVTACQRSRLSLPIGGQIDRILVKENDRVKEDQLLMVLWNRDRQARLEQAEAFLNSARLEREGICVSAQLDRRESNRLKGLVSRGLVSTDLADKAATKAQASDFQCQAAKAREEEAGAAFSLAKASLDQTRLYAPFDGMVAEVTGEVGEYSTPSPPGVATPPAIDLLTNDCHYVIAPIDEVDAADIRQGMPVRITMDAFRDQQFAGRVRRVAPYILDFEKQARTVDVEVDFEAEALEQLNLLAGYSADVEIIIEIREDALKIPTELLIEENKVMMLDSEGVLKLHLVTTGIGNWRETEIITGLSAGDQIVSSLGLPGVEVGKNAQVSDKASDAGND
ncbi:efflux RND transporter periplasmic adaptor subunit [Porticoccaceae bacterium LTM1]|nr:efflux RND transporter periplasmic adaptor subunit [Porticoccaceae bacterium LTM1]